MRRVVGPKYRGHVVVEARYAEARSVIDLATMPDVAGPGALAAEVVASDDVIARMLAQSARQEGVYHALREMLSFVGSELYLERVPHALVGKTFDEAHGALDGGVAVGYQQSRERSVLAPPVGDATKLGRKDRLIVLAPRKREYTTSGTLPEIADSVRALPFESTPERVLVIGFNRTLERLVLELDAILAKGSEIRVYPLGMIHMLTSSIPSAHERQTVSAHAGDSGVPSAAASPATYSKLALRQPNASSLPRREPVVTMREMPQPTST